MFTDPVLTAVARKHGEKRGTGHPTLGYPAGVAVIPKSVHRERRAENTDVWDFMLDPAAPAKCVGYMTTCAIRC